ncbi:MAG: hypothetical protein JXB29_09845 [Sedimentisphaerales bacterium]|nr:hypothetical protein [Sedimentisphaerales bacterium]
MSQDSQSQSSSCSGGKNCKRLFVPQCNYRVDFSCTCGRIQAENNTYGDTDKEWEQYLRQHEDFQFDPNDLDGGTNIILFERR